MAREKILVVDDEPSIVHLCVRVLDEEGYVAKGALSAEQALEMVKEESFDLLVTDIVMPGMDGLELLQKVREKYPEIGAVIITGYATLDFAVNSLKRGAQGFIVKPFTTEELKIAIQEALKKSRLNRENTRLNTLVPLFEVSKTLISEMELDKLLTLIADTLVRETKSDRVSLMLPDEETKELCIKATRGSSAEISNGEGVEKEIAGKVMKAGKPLILPDQSHQDLKIQGALKRAGISSTLCLPLMLRGKVIGALNASRLAGGIPFTRSDSDLASILCGQAAIAIENAKLNQGLRAQLDEREREKHKLEQQVQEITALNRFFKTQQDRLIEIDRSYRHIETLFVETLRALMLAIERKLSYIPGHSKYSARCIIPLAQAMSLPTEGLAIAACLHDVGMITVPSEILLKSEQLSFQEWELFRQHTVAGEKILEGIKFPWEVRSAVRHHHEHYDGTGYPDGLSGERIPITARLLGVIDSFESIYLRCPSPAEQALNMAITELQGLAGQKYDPKVVEPFVQLVRQGLIRPPRGINQNS